MEKNREKGRRRGGGGGKGGGGGVLKRKNKDQLCGPGWVTEAYFGILLVGFWFVLLYLVYICGHDHTVQFCVLCFFNAQERQSLSFEAAAVLMMDRIIPPLPLSLALGRKREGRGEKGLA